MGEKVKTISWNQKLNWQQALADMPERYVLLGLPEDIGVRAKFLEEEELILHGSQP
ncbi:MAG: hypothetical protein IPK10_04125 [Bacteroidetes bacterium]|nr:hypothetical protein [Bacteroidota bacterium]